MRRQKLEKKERKEKKMEKRKEKKKKSMIVMPGNPVGSPSNKHQARQTIIDGLVFCGQQDGAAAG